MSTPIATIDLKLLNVHGNIEAFEYHDRFGHPTEGFVLKHHDQMLAYRNECPHWNIVMDVDHLYDEQSDSLVCPYHGACFEPKHGECIAGPVEGMHLEPLQVDVDEQTGKVHVYLRRTLSLGF